MIWLASSFSLTTSVKENNKLWNKIEIWTKIKNWNVILNNFYLINFNLFSIKKTNIIFCVESIWTPYSD
jgi:hypothetical protein